jgi:hypothetical protein
MGLVSVASISVSSLVANRTLKYIIKKVIFNMKQVTGSLRGGKGMDALLL